MLKSKENKPLYMKKSKAAKQRELEIDEYERNDNFIDGIRNSPRKGEKYHRPKSKVRAHQREYFDDDDLYEQQYESSNVYGMEEEEDTNEYYVVDKRRYRHRKPKVEYYQSDFECSNSDCSVGCRVCENGKNRKTPEMWDYEYAGYRDQGQTRGNGDWYNHPRRTHGRRRYYSEFDYKMSYVNNNKYIYLANQPSGHRAFEDNKALDMKQISTVTENDSELYYYQINSDDASSKKVEYKFYDDKSEIDEEYSYRYGEKNEGSKVQKFPRGKNAGDTLLGHGLQYHVYTTQVNDKAGTVFMQHSIHKEEENIPLFVGLKNSESSTVVHLPVVYSKIQRQGKRIMPPKELRKVFEERSGEQTLETNTLVYAATNYEQKNVFQKEQDKVEDANLTNLQSITLYNVTQDDNPLQENKSGKQLEDTMPNASSTSVNKFPVDNAYIRVKSLNKSRSTHSLIGATGEGRIRGSGFFSKAFKKDKKLQELKKKKSKNNMAINNNPPKSDPESVISIINPIRHEDEYQESRGEKWLTKSKSKEKNVKEKMNFGDAGKRRKKTIAFGEEENNANDESKKTKARLNDNSYINSEDARKGVKSRRTAASVWNINPSKQQSGKNINKKVSKSRQNSEANKTSQINYQEIETPCVEQENQVTTNKIVSKSRLSSEANKTRQSKDKEIETPHIKQENQVPTNKKVAKSSRSSEVNKLRLSKDQYIETPLVKQANQVPTSKSLESFINRIEKKDDIQQSTSLKKPKSETAVKKNKKKDDIQQSTSLKKTKSETAVKKNKKSQNIFGRKKRASPVDDTKISQSSLHTKESGLIKRTLSKERSIQWSESETEFRETRILKQKDTILVKLFKATVIFLGIDTHGSLIKIFNCSEE